jgi:two-component system LytT family response regulator
VSLRALVVDDEPLCRERIRSMLARWPQFTTVEECAFGTDAVARLRGADFDLLFLDVAMPDRNGFEVLEQAGLDRVRLVIFITAYADYAVDAFEIHAFDYLLKPVDLRRFGEAVDRAVDALSCGDASGARRGEAPPRLSSTVPFGDASTASRLGRLLETVRPSPDGWAERLLVHKGPHLVFVQTSDVDWFESAGNYVDVRVGRETYVLRQSLVQLEAQLEGDLFVRIHRHLVVNLDALRALRGEAGECVAVLRTGETLVVSRRCRQKLESRFTARRQRRA